MPEPMCPYCRTTPNASSPKVCASKDEARLCAWYRDNDRELAKRASASLKEYLEKGGYSLEDVKRELGL